jgi:HAD superfamily hydrolase (TIGR01549 family)
MGRMPIHTLFLDAGGVLVLPNWPRIAAALGRHGVVVESRALAEAELAAKRQLDAEFHGRLPDARPDGWAYFDLVLARAGVPRSPGVDAAYFELRDYDARWNLWEDVPLDVAPALARLRGLGLALVVVSNSTGTLKALLERVGLAPRVDLVIDSHEEGVEKPDPALFRIALDRAGATGATTVHVGDLYHVDVVGARAAGLRAVLLDAGNLSPDADCPRVRSLGELADRLPDGALFRTSDSKEPQR